MKYLLFLLFALTSISTNAQNYTLTLKSITPTIYESLSGVVIVTDENCGVSEYDTVELHYFNNPADSSVGSSFDNFTYVVSEASIIGGVIEYNDVTKRCDVFGTARLRDTGVIPISSDAEAVYSRSSGDLYLYNVKLYDNLSDSGERINFARLKLNSDLVFVIQEVDE